MRRFEIARAIKVDRLSAGMLGTSWREVNALTEICKRGKNGPKGRPDARM